MNTWLAIGVTALGCYAVKLAGLLVPAGTLERPLVRRLAALLPVALLAALTAQQTFADGHTLVLDARVAGVAAAAVVLVLRAPFLLVVAARGGDRGRAGHGRLTAPRPHPMGRPCALRVRSASIVTMGRASRAMPGAH